MPHYVVFCRTPGFSKQWCEVSKQYAKNDLDAWYHARWGVLGKNVEVAILMVGFWAGVNGKYDRPSESEIGLPPYTEDERQLIRDIPPRA